MAILNDIDTLIEETVGEFVRQHKGKIALAGAAGIGYAAHKGYIPGKVGEEMKSAVDLVPDVVKHGYRHQQLQNQTDKLYNRVSNPDPNASIVDMLSDGRKYAEASASKAENANEFVEKHPRVSKFVIKQIAKHKLNNIIDNT